MKRKKSKIFVLSLLSGVALFAPQIAYFQVMKVDTLEYVSTETGKTEELVIRSYHGASNNNLYITESRENSESDRTINISLNGFYTPEEANAVKEKYESEITRIGGSIQSDNVVSETENPNKHRLNIVFRYPKDASEIDFDKFVDLYPPMLRSSTLMEHDEGSVHYATEKDAGRARDAFVEALKSEFSDCPEFEIVSTEVAPMQTVKGEYEYSVSYKYASACLKEFYMTSETWNNELNSEKLLDSSKGLSGRSFMPTILQVGFKTKAEADARRAYYEARISQRKEGHLFGGATSEDIDEPGTYFFVFSYSVGGRGEKHPAE